MTIGILNINCNGNLKTKESVGSFERSMRPSFDAVSDKIDFDYRRFAYFRASMTFVVHLREMWNNQTIFNNVRKYLDQNFTQWSWNIVLTIHQTGG